MQLLCLLTIFFLQLHLEHDLLGEQAGMSSVIKELKDVGDNNLTILYLLLFEHIYAYITIIYRKYEIQ